MNQRNGGGNCSGQDPAVYIITEPEKEPIMAENVKCECTQVDCVSANEIRTLSLQGHSIAMQSIQGALAAQVHNANFSQKMLETMAIKDFKEIDVLEGSVAKQFVPTPTGA